MLRSVRGRGAVLLHGKRVGELTFRSGGSEFVYDDDLLDPGHEVLGQVFEESPRGRFRTPTGLPAWFANLVPERGSGLRRYYAARFGAREIDDARLLLSLGEDLLGAATVVPLDMPDEGVLVDRAELRMREGGIHLSALTGAQPKMSVARDGERLTLPAEGETGGWIVKFPNVTWGGLVENEFLMMRWAATAGLVVPAVDLLPAQDVPDLFESQFTSESRVFVVERFDRDGPDRIHIEDFAQVTDRYPIDRDRDTTYDAIGAFILRRVGADGFAEYVRRLSAMVVMGNGDAHLKNWSLRYADGRTPALSPAYDLVCTTVYRNLGRRLVFTLGGQSDSDRVGAAEFERFAETAGSRPDEVVDLATGTARALREAWPEVRDPALAPELVAHIDERLDTHPLA